MKENSVSRACVPLVIVFAGLAPLMSAQQGRGTILGSVTDSSGAAVSAASVTIVNTATNTTNALQTNAEGLYSSPPLIPGNYQVSVEHAGFKKTVRGGITLQVDQR